jgi:hypothetical protein
VAGAACCPSLFTVSAKARVLMAIGCLQRTNNTQWVVHGCACRRAPVLLLSAHPDVLPPSADLSTHDKSYPCILNSFTALWTASSACGQGSNHLARKAVSAQPRACGVSDIANEYLHVEVADVALNSLIKLRLCQLWLRLLGDHDSRRHREQRGAARHAADRQTTWLTRAGKS